ncbi:MAG: preprotein translocase subunit SecE [Candidatus Omnitrophota bacterium]|nr:preprotein translocase subunit SecE [Candidatus Omnitrophota bacterium]
MFGKVGNFFSETKQELNKVTWPSKDELWQSTIVVIVTSMILAVFIGIVDFFLSIFVRILLG